MSWEEHNKPKILEWKNIRRRLHASGDNPSPDVVDISNLEKHRPRTASHELNLDNAVIKRASIHIPPDVEIRNTMTDAERFAAKFGMYQAMAEQGDERAKAILALFSDDDADPSPDEPVQIMANTVFVPDHPDSTKPVKKQPTKKQLAARKANGERLKKMHAEKRRKKAEALKAEEVREIVE